jgi:hypothetical protein
MRPPRSPLHVVVHGLQCPSGLGTRGRGNADWVKNTAMKCWGFLTPSLLNISSSRRPQLVEGGSVARNSLTGDGEQVCAHCCDSYTYLPKVYLTMNQLSSNPYLWPTMVTRHYVLRITRPNKDAIDGFIANYRYGLTFFGQKIRLKRCVIIKKCGSE